jgi:hypothetical protein
MRIWAVIIVGGALLAYGLSWPPPIPAPSKTAFADLSTAAATKPVSVPLPPARPPTASTAAPLNIVPQPQPKTVAGPATSSAPTSSAASTKRTAEVLTAAAIVALIIEESRRAYYATGRPCACPDDTMRSGRRCGGRSAHSRPGGASPLCYPADVSEAMIRELSSQACRTMNHPMLFHRH